jgi:hypothetical protein
MTSGYFIDLKEFDFWLEYKNLWSHLVSVGKLEWQNLVEKNDKSFEGVEPLF